MPISGQHGKIEHCLKNKWTKYRFVCTHFNVFSTLIQKLNEETKLHILKEKNNYNKNNNKHTRNKKEGAHSLNIHMAGR